MAVNHITGTNRTDHLPSSIQPVGTPYYIPGYRQSSPSLSTLELQLNRSDRQDLIRILPTAAWSITDSLLTRGELLTHILEEIIEQDDVVEGLLWFIGVDKASY